jgi:hypothetical protein
MFLVCIVLGWVLATLEGWEPLEVCGVIGLQALEAF